MVELFFVVVCCIRGGLFVFLMFFFVFLIFLFLFILCVCAQYKEPYRRLWKSSLRSEVLVRSGIYMCVYFSKKARMLHPICSLLFCTSYNTLQSLQKFLSILDYCTFASITTELHYNCPNGNISL